MKSMLVVIEFDGLLTDNVLKGIVNLSNCLKSLSENPDVLDTPWWSLMKVFFMSIVTVNGDSERLKLRLDFFK